ncbi:MAG: Asp-tRNA(Asn)/Glu-tRNA(Gln) amidotransferase subunit GatC [Spirochaetes bacterium]|nr:Asp-tRNA(Asn)/Glu-tRNA(Gln) amidotransferase subunit GatC [Spirochaetota bacterium]
MKIDGKTIQWVAELSQLYLSAGEEAEMKRHLVAILDYMAILNELDLEDVEPTSHTLGYSNVMRDDIAKESFDVGIVEDLAPRWEKGHIVVPRVV